MKITKGLDCCKSLLIFLLMVIFPSSGSYALDVRGIIDSDTLWASADSPVNITGDLLVTQGATLIIEPGVQVIFQPRADTARGYCLNIEGALSARGNDTQPIVFTAQNRDVPWGAIVFRDTSEDWNDSLSAGSVLSNCLFEYGGNDPEGSAMITTFNAMPLISNNAIRFSSTGGIASFFTDDAVSLSGTIQILDNQIYNNRTGLIISAEGGLIEGNYFLNNSRAVNILSRSNVVAFRGNTIVGSTRELLGLGVLLQSGEPGSGIKDYLWEQSAGPDVILENPNSSRASFIAPDPGTNVEKLIFNLKVTGSNGKQSTESITVTVIGLNEPPVASAGRDVNVKLAEELGPEVEVTLSGAESFDPTIGIAGYQWVQEAGTAVSLENPNAVATSFFVPASVDAGARMTFRLTVTNQAGLQSSDTVDIMYYRDNIYPTADAGEDFKTLQGQLVYLDGSASRDPDDGISSYLWQQTDGPAVELFNFFTAKPFFVAPTTEGNDETLSFELSVMDTGGLQDVDTVFVQIKGTTVAVPGDDQTVSAGDSVILDGRGSFDTETSADVAIEANDFQSDSAEAGLLALTSVENARIRLRVSGNNIVFTETSGYGAYLYEWPENASDIDISENWWGTDDPAMIDEMIFDRNDDYLLPTIIYQPFAALPIDGTGSRLNYPPIANAGADIETAMDLNVTLDGSNSYDPDDIAVYQWRQIDGTAVTLRNPEASVATFVAPKGGGEGQTLRFSLTVTTGGVFSHTDEVDVTIRPDETVPVVEAGGDCFIQTANFQRNMENEMDAMLIKAWAGLIIGLAFALILWKGRVKSLLVVILISTATFVASDACAGFFAVGGGGGGDAGQYNITLETGAKDISAGDLNLLFAIGIPFIPHGDDNLPNNTIAFPCPNNECRDAGEERKGTEIGFYGKLGLELGSTNLFLNAIGGFTIYTESRLSQSTGSGAYYEESSDTTIGPLYGAGLSYFTEDLYWPLVIQIDYDLSRGVTGTIGWYW
jgi:hypothetical protein